MSSSAREDIAEDTKVDELDEAAADAETAPAPADPPKRKRGRPPGSKNKKTLAAQPAPAGPSTAAGTTGEPPVVKRGRGRPPKVRTVLALFRRPTAVLIFPAPPHPQRKPEDAADAEPQPKRKRGRPPKVKPAAPPPAEASGDDGGDGDAVDAAPKKKRGRPRKDAS